PGGVTKIAATLDHCVDVNGDGMITTSTGPADIKPKGQDECVLWFKPIPSPGYTYGVRATAWEGVKADPITCVVPTPRLWFAWMDGNMTAHFMRVDGATGAAKGGDNLQYGLGFAAGVAVCGGGVAGDGSSRRFRA
ncbi:MAG TPA: hypothetical protein PKZ52_18225, partial [Cellvibrionaceae bacterium]|nr:hypothetical protein [Cellvibrionaceae bacterium]